MPPLSALNSSPLYDFHASFLRGGLDIEKNLKMFVIARTENARMD